jgi:UDP-GlcNAc:undecaprenyl-phosphate GlcNAc-1-phosphate transferase
MRRWARAHDFVDRPGGHKGHAAPVALGGGVVVTLAVIIPVACGVLVARWLAGGGAPGWVPAGMAVHLPGIVAKMPAALGICVAAAVMCAMGVVDDRRALGAGVKFLVQIAVAAVLVVGFNLRLLSHLPAPISIALSMLWILTLTNSLNFLDNMDGLSSGVALIASLVFGATSILAGQVFVPACCALLAGALLGFLPYNFHPATIYLGDAGSTVVGMLLAVFTILTTFVDPSQPYRPIGVIAPLIVMAVPLYDTASVFFLRWRLGVPLWKGDRRHFSHRLVRRGMRVPVAVLVIWLTTLVTALPALLLPRANWMEASVIVLQALFVVMLVALLEKNPQMDTDERR